MASLMLKALQPVKTKHRPVTKNKIIHLE